MGLNAGLFVAGCLEGRTSNLDRHVFQYMMYFEFGANTHTHS